MATEDAQTTFPRTKADQNFCSADVNAELLRCPEAGRA